jgi:aminomethyltransferase
MARLFGEGVLDLRYYWLMVAEFQGSGLVISRTGWSGEFGYEIYLENPAQGDALFDALLEEGRDCNAAPGAVNQTRRIESGILSWGVDMTLDDNPYQLGMGRLVELDDTPQFIGRDALIRLKNQPLDRTIVGLAIDGAALSANEDIWPVLADGTAVGKLTSLTYSPRLERNIAIGQLPPALAAPGTALSVETWDGLRSATVTTMPFLPKLQNGSARELAVATKA